MGSNPTPSARTGRSAFGCSPFSAVGRPRGLEGRAIGGMVERTKATVLKTVGPGNRSRGFESHSLRERGSRLRSSPPRSRSRALNPHFRNPAARPYDGERLTPSSLDARRRFESHSLREHDSRLRSSPPRPRSRALNPHFRNPAARPYDGGRLTPSSLDARRRFESHSLRERDSRLRSSPPRPRSRALNPHFRNPAARPYDGGRLTPSSLDARRRFESHSLRERDSRLRSSPPSRPPALRSAGQRARERRHSSAW